MLVILARHHHGGGRPPSEALGHREDLLVRDYLAAAEDELLALGHQVLVVSGVHYGAGHSAARQRRADVFVAGHVNAGGYHSGCCFHDYRSRAGRGLARHAADALGLACPELGGTKVIEATPEDWTVGAYGAIAGVYEGHPVGLTYEPFFIDQADHAALAEPEGLRRVGVALASGIHTWAESQET